MNDGLRLLVVAQEFPFPPNHGGRADVWRRLQVLRRLGCRIALVCWYDDVDGKRPTQTALEVVREVVDHLEALPIRRSFLMDLLRISRIVTGMPSHAASRVIAGVDSDRVMVGVRHFAPEAMLLDSLYGGAYALVVCNMFNVPMFYRAHNIEHRYFASQAAAAKRLRDKIAWHLACLHLERFEKQVLLSSAAYFDISSEDMVFWRERGVVHGHWLPPLSEVCVEPSLGTISSLEPASDIGFLGNLNAPNNVRGVIWLVREIMPIVWESSPDTVLTVAGSRPNDEVRTLLASDARLRLLENIASAPGFLAGARVLVNPVLSGSGVNVKTLDMLMTNRPIVSTPQGVAGLVPELKSLCLVAEGPERFAQYILGQLETPAVDLPTRERGRRLFSADSVKVALDCMTRIVRQKTSSPGQGSVDVCASNECI